jgi:hypothetical protein
MFPRCSRPENAFGKRTYVDDLKLRLERLIEISLKACQSWLSDDGRMGYRLIDPVDHRAVEAHYGDSHLAAALVILGRLRGDTALLDQGARLVRTILRDWDSSAKLWDFHHDFNNFALCLIDESMRDIDPEISGDIRLRVLSTRDSNHDTVNWLPMRGYVNRSRYDWVNDRRYREDCNRSLAKVRSATNDDGGIEDRLPPGSSYNLQYNISSLASMQLMRTRWQHQEFDLARSLGYLLDRILPDGDINYVGRGTNQIFAWGPWLYSLSSARKSDALGVALQFVEKRYPEACNKSNILFNDFLGVEKVFWWDYHYCSVYHAHFLLWCVLALRDYGVCEMQEGAVSGAGTGLTLARGDFGGVAMFAGRTAYLAEAGPAICALWLSDGAMLFKGGLGPWEGVFGRKYSYADAVFQNHFGLVSQSATSPISEHRLIRKLLPKRRLDRSARIRPIFADPQVEIGPDRCSVLFSTDGHAGYLNVPVFEQQADKIQVEFSVDGKKLETILMGRSRNQYGWIHVLRSRASEGKRWTVTIS